MIYGTSGVVEWLIKHEANPLTLKTTAIHKNDFGVFIKVLPETFLAIRVQCD